MSWLPRGVPGPSDSRVREVPEDAEKGKELHAMLDRNEGGISERKPGPIARRRDVFRRADSSVSSPEASSAGGVWAREREHRHESEQARSEGDSPPWP